MGIQRQVIQVPDARLPVHSLRRKHADIQHDGQECRFREVAASCRNLVARIACHKHHVDLRISIGTVQRLIDTVDAPIAGKLANSYIEFATRQRKQFVDVDRISRFEPIGCAVNDQRNVNVLLRKTERR